jgi:hypothetical protein
MSAKILQKGEHVVMHTCYESEKYDGKVWTCITDEFQDKGKQWVVFLDGFSGYFSTEFLQKVNLEP